MSSKRALIIDEDVEARRILRDSLHQAGWIVEEAPGGVEALELITQARAYGEGYNCVFSELFLPDTDGALFLSTLKSQCPALKFVILSALDKAEHAEWIDEFRPELYLTKPLQAEEFMGQLNDLEFTGSTMALVPPEIRDLNEPPIGAYIYVKFTTFELADKLYSGLRALDGVISANAVKGEGFDLVMRIGADTSDAISEITERVRQFEGVASARHEFLDQPPLSLDLHEFVGHYMNLTHDLHADYVAGVATNAYLMIDIDRYQLERIYLSILLTEGVIRCRVLKGFNKMMVLSAGAVQPNVVRHLLRKLAQLDGIRRVREVTVVNMNE